MFIGPLLNVNLRPKLYSWIKQTRNVKPVVKIGREKFQLLLDVHQFSKEELRVKARSEYVIIEGKQERRTKKGLVLRKFIRKFKLPDGCSPQKIESHLSPDGYLTVTAHRNSCNINWPCETLVPISYSPKVERESPSLVGDKPLSPAPDKKPS